MKRIIATTILLFASALAQAQDATTPGAARVLRNNDPVTGPATGMTTTFLAMPPSGAQDVMYLDGTTRLPKTARLGAGLSIASGIITATQAQADWAASTGSGVILNKPTFATVAFSADYADLIGRPALGTAAAANTPTSGNATAAQVVLGADTRLTDARTPLAHTHPAAQISDSTSTGRAVLTAADAAAARTAIDAYPGSANPAGYLTSVSSAQITAALGFTPYSAANPAGYITTAALSGYATTASLSGYVTTSALTAAGYVTQAGARSAITLATTGTGAATYNSGTGVLTIPTPAAATPFNFSQPVARTINASTSYQATDPTKAAIIVPSYACQNATQVLASSACTIQARMGTGTLTCSTGTVYYTQSLTVALGVLITQNSTNPVQINLPIGGSFILCPVAGTFTVSAVEQTAG